MAPRRSPSPFSRKPDGRGLEPPPGSRGGARPNVNLPSTSPPDDDVVILSPGPDAAIPRLRKGQIAATSVARSPSPRQNNGKPSGFAGEDIPSPLPPLTGSFDNMDLRESAYELLMGVTGARTPLPRAQTEPTAPEEAPRRWGGKMFGLGRAEQRNVADAEAQLYPTEVIRRQLEISDFSDQRTRKALTRASASQVTGYPLPPTGRGKDRTDILDRVSDFQLQ